MAPFSVIGLAAGELAGDHGAVAGNTSRSSSAGSRRPALLLAFGQAEVEHARLIARVDDDITRLEVAMHNAQGMGRPTARPMPTR